MLSALRIPPNPLNQVSHLAALLNPLPSPADCPGASGTCTTAPYNLACLTRKARVARIPQQHVHTAQMERHQTLPELLRLTNTRTHKHQSPNPSLRCHEMSRCCCCEILVATVLPVCINARLPDFLFQYLSHCLSVLCQCISAC